MIPAPLSHAAPLSERDVARFREEGFLTIEEVAAPGEIARLREIFTRLFAARTGWEQGALFDLAGTDEQGRSAALPQILNPAQFAPELRSTPLRLRALALARQLLGPTAEPWFEHAILKPAERGGATPWHQDEAHRDDAGVEYEQVSIWVPLQAATLENGCMRYIPGSHLGPVLPHRSPGDNPRIMALECAGGFALETMVHCPLLAGGAVAHHSRTLHSAGPNFTGEPRLAWVLAFRGPVREGSTFAGYAWNREKQTAAQARSAAWEQRGGLLGRTGRRATALAHRGLGRLRRLLRS